MSLKKRISAAIFPWYSLSLDQVNNNARIRIWMRENRDVPKFSSRNKMFVFLNERFLKDKPIDFLEFGVFEGESLSTWANINERPESRFFGFDSFVGLPEDWGKTLSAGAFDLGGVLPHFTDDRVRLIKGWFQDTLPDFQKTFHGDNRLVIHIDSDLYSSAMYVLTRMDSFIKPKTMIIFDEFSSALHEFRALDDYSRAYRRVLKPVAMTSPFADQAAFIVER